MASKIIFLFLCFSFFSLAEPKSARNPDSLLFVEDSLKEFQLGVVATGNSNYASLSYASSNSNGFGFSFGINVKIPLFEILLLNLATSYQVLTLTVTLPEATQLEATNNLTVSQTVQYVNLSAIFNIPIGVMKEKINSPFRFWLDLGGEYLYAIAGSQDDYRGVTTALVAPESLVFGVLGPSVSFSMGRPLLMHCFLHGFYNFMSTSAATLYGIRIGASLQYGF